MKKKISIVKRLFIIFLISFIFIFGSPFYSEKVSAAVPITICDWDGIASGLSNGSDGYIDFECMAGYSDFITTTDYDLSSPNGFKFKPYDTSYPKGWWNLTSDFPYIGQFNISYYQTGGTGNQWVEFQFYDEDDNIVIKFKMAHGYGVADETLQWYDISTGWETIYNTNIGDNFRYYLIVTHNGTNQFNITVLDSSFTYKYGRDLAGSYADIYSSFSNIYLKTPVFGGGEGFFVFDNFIIDTTWTGDPENPPEGYLKVHCYDEINGTNISGYNFLAINQLGHTYFDYNLSGTYSVPGVLLPQGECIVTISHSDYYPRSYLIYVEEGYFIIDGITYDVATIDAYLPPINLSALYYIQVVDEYLYPVEDANVLIQGFCGGVSYKNVSSTNTDGYGMTNAYLCWGRQYSVTISKDGFVTRTENWIPDPSNYGIDHPKIFKISRIPTEWGNLTPIYFDSMVLTAYNDTTMQIDYLNLNNDNSYVNFTVIDYFNNSVLIYYNVSSYPNNITLLFTYSNYNLTGDILKVIAVAYRSNGSIYTITKYFNIQQIGSGGMGASAIAVIISIGVCLFGLTLAHPKHVLGVVGIITMVIGLIITAFADQSIWFIHLIQAIELILLIFIIMVFREEGVHAV